MKSYHTASALIRATLFIAAAASASRSFSVSDDVLAFPQYEIRFLDDWTSESEAEARLRQTSELYTKPPSYDQAHARKDGQADAPSSQIGQYTPQSVPHDSPDGQKSSVEDIEYEYMVLDGQRWLCAVPRVASPDATSSTSNAVLNETQTRLDEEKELVRATSRGWELLAGMADHCVYFNAGYWSYRLCYDQGVKQFHQLPPGGNVPRWPPAEDPGVVGFVLGAYENKKKDKKAKDNARWEGESGVVEASGVAAPNHAQFGELVQRGDTRYLVQRLAGGTVCDLTGKERRIEIQFHCNPSGPDRISLIKEVSTCAYLMVVQTPRLCNDVAFQPPQKDHPHSVTCSPILAEEEVTAYEASVAAIKELDKETAKLLAKADISHDQTEKLGAGAKTENNLGRIVGDIVIGGHQLVPVGKTIPKSGIVGGAGKETYMGTVATSDGSKTLSKADLEKLGLTDMKDVERLKKELERIAKGESWRLDVVDAAGRREYRGIIGSEKSEDEPDGPEYDKESAPTGTAGQHKGKKNDDKSAATTGDGEKKKTKKQQQQQQQQQKPPEGSEEEFFKEEL